MSGRPIEVIDGKWLRLRKRNGLIQWRLICCDCGLTHDLDLSAHDEKPEIRYQRNRRSTALTRRQRRYPYQARDE